MQTKEIQKVLVANRGEIAIRIFRACHDLGIHTVAIYSNEDTYSLFRTKADEAYLVGEKKSPLGAYLDIPGIIGLAKRRGVTAIHPGYGFLSENADFARACEENGILFIGPSAKVLGQMGDKLSAKEIALACGVPIIPGCTEPLRDAEDAVEKAVSFGFPVILKAAAGGGGRGMRRCDSPEEVRTAYELVHSEAEKAFGCGDIFMEKYLVEPKHIEVQDPGGPARQRLSSGRAGLLPPAAVSEGGGVRPGMVRPAGDGGGAAPGCRENCPLGGVRQRRYGGVSGG